MMSRILGEIYQVINNLTCCYTKDSKLLRVDWGGESMSRVDLQRSLHVFIGPKHNTIRDEYIIIIQVAYQLDSNPQSLHS